MTGHAALELRLLGRFVVFRDGREVPSSDFGGRKVRALLRILAIHRGRFLSHDELAEMLWGDRPPRNPAANLQVLVNRARRAVGRPDLILTGPSGYSLTNSVDCRIDAEQFVQSVDRAATNQESALDQLSDALACWYGDPLAEDIYQDWAADYRARLLRTRQRALERAAHLAIESGRTSSALEFATIAADTEPLREVAVLTLVRAITAAGDPSAALHRYDEFRKRLAQEMGLDPSPVAIALQREILNASASWTPPVARPSLRPTYFDALAFVGRDAELRALRTWARSPGRTPVLVAGSSGSGKSRLLQAFSSEIRTIGVRAFLAERDEPWSLARSLFREILAGDATADHELPEAMRRALASLLPELDVGVGVVTPDPESTRSLLVEAALRLTGMIPGSVLVIDDLQWTDPSSAAVLGSLLTRRPHLQVLLACRPEEIPRDSDLGRLIERLAPDLTVTVEPLSTNDIHSLVDDNQLAGVIARATDRSPLAVTEVIRSLAADGLVRRTVDGRWRSTGTAAAERGRDVAAAGQRRAIASRADAFDPRVRELLEILALVAREVDIGLLSEATASDHRTVLDRLTALSRAGLVRLGDQGWATGHDMIGDVLAARLPPAERGRIHTLIAGALETMKAEPAERARHWLGAGESMRAAAAYGDAAAQALAGFADLEAVELATAGLSVVSHGPQAARLAECRAQSRMRLGDISGARIDFRAALAVFPSGPDRARLLGRLARLASGSDDLVRAAELAELALIEAGSDPPARAGALEIAAVLDMNLGRGERAERRAGQALALYQQIGDGPGSARILDARAMATFLAGDVRKGTALLGRVANLFEDSGDLTRVVTPRSTSGHGLVFSGHPDDGLRLTSAALEVARALGHPEGQTYALWHRTEALAALGRHQEATEAAQEALSIATRIEHRGWTATAWRATGIAFQAAGDPESALVAFRASLDASEHFDLFACWAAARAASVMIGLGRLEDATPLVERALAEGPPLGHYEARLASVELAAARGDPGTPAMAAEALRLADEGGVRQGRDRLVELAGRN